MFKKLFTILTLSLSLFTAKSQYTGTSIVSNLEYPVCLAIAPDDRLFVSLRGGSGFGANDNGQVVVYNPNGSLQGIIWDFTDSIETNFERGVLGVALDPDFSNNHFVYVFYNHLLATVDKIRVVRLTETNGVGSNPLVILDIIDPHSAGNHTGGNVHFGPDGKLYVSIGDRATTANSQDLTKPFGKFLRINSDGTIPTDNPFYDDGNPIVGNDDRIWSYGHRNHFDFTFSAVNDSLYSTENGATKWDEVNMIHKGGNYGWPACEGFFNNNSTTVPCSVPTSELPLDDWGAPLPAVTGIVIYDHTLMPEFTNHLLVVDYEGIDITNFTLGNSPAYDTVIARSTVPITLSGLTDICVGNEGCLYVIEGGYTASGKIKRICPTGMSINENNEVRFSVYPNPSNGVFTVNVNSDFIGASLKLTDISGRLIYSQTLGSLATNFDMNQNAKGIYLVEIAKDGKSATQKIIIE